MNHVRCAVIGAGWWGTTAHLPALIRHPRAELVAVQHHDADTARRIARDFGARFACTTVDEVLDHGPLDAVIISSVPTLHYSQARAALQRGCHVLVEKPITVHADEAAELNDLAAREQRILILGATWHYTRHCVAARSSVMSGRFGQLRMISILMTNLTQGLYRGLPFAQAIGGQAEDVRDEHQQPYLEPGRSSYSDPALAGGGQILCQTSHPAAYVSFLTERQPVDVFARFENDHAPVDVYNAINFTLDDGTLVSLATSGAAVPQKLHYELRLFGTEGILEQDLWQGTLTEYGRDGSVIAHPPLPSEEIYPLYAPATNLINTILGLAENGSPARHGVFAARIADAAVASARCGNTVRL